MIIYRYIFIGMSLLPLLAGDEPSRTTEPQFAVDVVARKTPRNVLSNEGIVLLSDAGYDEDFLMDIIIHKQTRFDMTVEGLAYLANHGISERIVRFMVANENKSAGPEAVSAPVVANTVVPARVVWQKVLVPDTTKLVQVVRQPVTSPLYASVAVQQNPAPMYAPCWRQAGYAPATSCRSYAPYACAAPAASYAIAERHLFWNRWYIVNPPYATVGAPGCAQWQYPGMLHYQAGNFPVW